MVTPLKKVEPFESQFIIRFDICIIFTLATMRRFDIAYYFFFAVLLSLLFVNEWKNKKLRIIRRNKQQIHYNSLILRTNDKIINK